MSLIFMYDQRFSVGLVIGCLLVGKKKERKKVNGLPNDSFLFPTMSFALMMEPKNRPQNPHPSKSFSRLVSSPSSPNARSRASTLQTVPVARDSGSEMTSSWLDENGGGKQEDIFEKNTLVSGAEGTVRDVNEIESPQDVPDGFDELPIELVSLIDR